MFGPSIVIVVWAASLVWGGVEARASALPFLLCEALALIAYGIAYPERIRRMGDWFRHRLDGG